ncbi:tRNA(Met) cytidine acetyltransferase TmcA [Vibrio tetraodonis]|nr:GNAT family N-acetyltransferase [Vibrio tetraodonis]
MLDYFTRLIELARQTNHRYGLVMYGDHEWTSSTIDTLKSLVSDSDIVQLGGPVSDDRIRHISYKQGNTLLGQECELLICDFSGGFDANSFCAALGSVRGGGFVVILPWLTNTSSLAQQWLQGAFKRLIQLEQSKPLPKVKEVKVPSPALLGDQVIAIEKIKKVSTGHRKRPLVMTADRGRGKSSALGIASAELMEQRQIKILVTAPSLATVRPVFEHAQKQLLDAQTKKGKICYSHSSIEFIAPDELLTSQPECDLLLVDEASAIPIPMLQKVVTLYHRCVFSTTVHGYEGCGRGFTVKFQDWLEDKRPNTSFFHLNQPIRWAKDDPLENWLFETFLLDAELEPLKLNRGSDIRLEKVLKQNLIKQPSLLRASFALLVNAHYQTAPSDLMLLLEEEAIQLYIAFSEEACIGCVMTIDEGGLEDSLIKSIQHGKRRPRGHLVPVTLANQLGISHAARQHSTRIMRIAIHPDAQRMGIGTEMLSRLTKQSRCDFMSTSFGATDELIRFWTKAGFSPVKLGTQRDQASGCHSIIMIKGEVDWLENAVSCHRHAMIYLLSSLFSDVEVDIVRRLLVTNNMCTDKAELPAVVDNYSMGGASYESVVPFLFDWILSSPILIKASSDLLVRKVLQQRTWRQCCEEFVVPGRKQLEQKIRDELRVLIKSNQE